MMKNTFVTIFIALVLILLVADYSWTETATEFGAETVEDDSFGSALTLPTELVEEKSEPDSPTSNTLPPASGTGADTTSNGADDTSSKSALPNEDATLDPATTKLLCGSEIDLEALVKAFSTILKRNYIVDSAVKGKVTVHCPSDPTFAEAMRIFDAALHMRGFTTVPMGDQTWKVILGKDAQKTTIPLVLDSPTAPSDVLVTELLRLKYVTAEDVQKLLTQFISKDGLVNTISGTNAIILIDSAANIARLKELIQQVDVPARDQDITIIPIVHADAKDIADKVGEILGEKNKESSTSNTTPRIIPRTPTNIPGRVSGEINPISSTFSEGRGLSRQALPLKIIPDERTNSIIIVADQEMTMKVRALIEQLDSEMDRSGGRFYVYSLKHADAEELADVLNSVISGSSDSSGTRSNETDRESTQSTGSSLTRSSRELSDRRATTPSERLSRALSSRTFFSPFGSSERQGEGKVNFEGEVSIAADPSTNTLIINASRGDYLKVKELIDKLDVKRQQVLVEATILEVSLSKSDALGMALQTSAGTDSGGILAQSTFGGEFAELIKDQPQLADLTVAAASTGTITLPGGLTIPSQAVIIKAVSDNGNVNVLSAPTILTTDNVEAEIIVGENVPFVSNTSTDPSNLNNTFNQVERQDVGIKLRITPQIGTGGFVTLKIFVEISNVIEDTRDSANGPSTTVRTTETTVEVKNNQMIVTGGLIADNSSDSESGVPYLKEIPVLGNLFKTTRASQRRTNLLIFITPRILSDQFDAREATVEKRDQLEGIIEEQNSYPKREEVLHRDTIDNVAGQDESERPLPSTITPPPDRPLTDTERSAIERTNSRLNALLKRQKSDPPSDDDILELTVKPKLPGESANSRQAMPAEMEPQITERRNVYIVLRQLGENNGAAGESLGLVMLGSLNAPTSKFFQAGEKYLHTSGNREKTFVCLGVYGSNTEAALIHPEMKIDSTWKNLSASEIFSLGTGAWKKANTRS